jgi:REP-associated tyrosine transposase
MELNRTFFVTSVTHSRRAIFTVEKNAELFINVLYVCRKEAKLLLHAFVVMPDHFHILITPSDSLSLERCVQFVKGRFSFQLHSRLSVWQPGFTNHRVRDAQDFRNHVAYIHSNSVKGALVPAAEVFPYSSANPQFQVDQMPRGLKPQIESSITRA